ncbi:MAG: hypothetical protein ACYC7H_04805, partial [Chloroflexota bacterium]
MICADAGFGKTTLLREFANACHAKVIWYSLDSSDLDITQLVSNLAEALHTHFPDLTLNPSLSDGTTISAAKPESLAFLLAHELDEVGSSPLAIVLDNYEKVGSSEHIGLLVRTLIDSLPKHVHIVIGTRERPNLPLSLLRSRQDLLEMDKEDLAMDYEEIRKLLTNLYNLMLRDSELKLLAEKTEGWAAGVVMVAQHLRQHGSQNASTFIEKLSGETRLIYDYLADEVLRNQTVETQSFLLKTSILPRLDVSLCADLSGVTNAQRILVQLEDNGLFTYSVSERRDCFRYHRLFQEFLRERLHQHLAPEAIRALHLKAAVAIEAAGEVAEAHRQYSLAGELDAAANLVERVADKYLERGRMNTVMHWLRRTPEDLISTRPWLLAVYGKALRRYGDTTAALDRLQQAYRLFAQQDDKLALAWVAYELSILYHDMGAYQEALRIAEQLLAVADAGSIERARLLRALGRTYVGLDQLDKGEQLAKIAIDELADMPRDPEVAILSARAHRLLTWTHARQGRLQSALQLADHVLDLCRLGNLGDLQRSWAFCARGEVLARSGELQAALESLRAAEDAGGRHHQLLRETINLWRGNAYRDLGDQMRAAENYERAGEHGLVQQAYLLLLQGEIQQSMSMVQKASRIFESGHGPAAQATAKVVLGLVFAARGEVNIATDHLTGAIATFEGLHLQQETASTYLHLARLEFSENDYAGGMAHLSSALDISARCGLRHFMWWDSGKFAFLAGQAIKAGVHVPHVADILRFKFAGECATQLLDLLSFPDSAVRDFVDGILAEVASETLSGPGANESLVANL